jgi:hypothetical protein
MTAIPLARYLVDFGSERKTDPVSEARSEVARQVEMNARIVESRVLGMEDGRAAAEAEFAGRLDQHRKDFEAQLVTERQTWVDAQANVLCERLVAGLRDVETRIANATARIIQPFLSAQMRSQSIAALVDTLEPILTKDPGVKLEISGPEDLLQALRHKLDGKGLAATYNVNAAPDVRIAIDQTIIETQLEAWMSRIREATP